MKNLEMKKISLKNILKKTFKKAPVKKTKSKSKIKIKNKAKKVTNKKQKSINDCDLKEMEQLWQEAKTARR